MSFLITKRPILDDIKEIKSQILHNTSLNFDVPPAAPYFQTNG